MSRNIQRELKFDDGEANPVHLPPEGYKGLSSFHKYWGKKPIETWRFLIENLTETNDIVLDPFLGSGLIAKECTDLERRFIGFDINPISIELTKLYFELPSHLELNNAISQIENNVKNIINDMYLMSNGHVATHFLWEQDSITRIWTKIGRNRVDLDIKKRELEKLQNIPLYKLKNARDINLFDNSRINSKESFSLEDLFTPRALRTIDMLKEEIKRFDGNLKRALLLILSSSLGQMSKMVFAVSKRGKTKGKEVDRIDVGSWVIGYWRPKLHFEINAWNCFENKARKLLKAVKEVGKSNTNHIAQNIENLLSGNGRVHVDLGDSEQMLIDVPSSCVKVVLTDPPHGDRIPYLELSEMWNSVIGLDSNYAGELVVSNAKERDKDISAYNAKLSVIFAECVRILADNGLMVVIFNARANEHWDGLHQLENTLKLEYVGCYPMEYSAGSVVQDNRKGGLKTDYVLLYGKNLSITKKKNVENKFSMVKGWSTSHPKKAE